MKNCLLCQICATCYINIADSPPLNAIMRVIQGVSINN